MIKQSLYAARRIHKRVYWKLLLVLGMKQRSWDDQFNANIWSQGPHSDNTIQLVTELCEGGAIVEFGCAEGRLPCSLGLGTFSGYTGYDVSEVAIAKAKLRAKSAGVVNCQFEIGDMASWEGCKSASLIVFEECLYYLSKAEVKRILKICSDSLISTGKILVIVHSAKKHRDTLNTCRETCSVMKEIVIEDRTYLVCKPR